MLIEFDSKVRPKSYLSPARVQPGTQTHQPRPSSGSAEVTPETGLSVATGIQGRMSRVEVKATEAQGPPQTLSLA